MSKRPSLFPTPLALLKDDLDVILKLFVAGSGIAAFFLLIYLHSIGFSEVFLPALGSPQVLIAFFFGGAAVAAYFSIVFLLPVPMIDPSDSGIADVYKELGILGAQKFLALLAFPAVMSLSYFTQELWPILMFLFVLQLGIVSYGVREDINNITVAIKWFFVAAYWWFVALLMSFPMLVILKLTGGGEMRQWLSLFVYVVVLVLAAAFVKRVGWKVFLVFVATLLVVVPFWANEQFVAGAARLLGARHDDLRWYWVDSKVVPTLPGEIDSKKTTENKGCYVEAVTPFSTPDIHILCGDNKSPSRDNCILAFDKSDAKAVTIPKLIVREEMGAASHEGTKEGAPLDAQVEHKSKVAINRNYCILTIDKSDAKAAITDLRGGS